MDPMSVLATQYNDGLARQRAAAGWANRPPRRRSILRRIGRLARPTLRARAERPARRAVSPLGTARGHP